MGIKSNRQDGKGFNTSVHILTSFSICSRIKELDLDMIIWECLEYF